MCHTSLEMWKYGFIHSNTAAAAIQTTSKHYLNKAKNPFISTLLIAVILNAINFFGFGNSCDLL